MPTSFLRILLLTTFVVSLALSPAAKARDEKSIKALRDAIVALGSDVDPAEADKLSLTVHQKARELAKKYRIVLNPSFQNLLINIGARDRGYCAHYVRDIGTVLREMKFKTLVLHWGAAWARQPDESNCLVVTARNQPFEEGIIMDAWRRAGRLYWCKIHEDHEYEEGHPNRLNQLGSHRYSGVTAWKEDLQESAWLQGAELGSKATPKPTR